MAAADLAARDLVDGVRGVAARGLAARGVQAGGEPRAAPRGGDAEAHAQAGLVVVFHGPSPLAWSPPQREVGDGGVGRAGSGRGGFGGGLEVGARVLGAAAPWEGKLRVARRRGKWEGLLLQTARTENRQGYS